MNLVGRLQNISLKKTLLFSASIRLLVLPLTYHGDVTVTYWWGRFASQFGWRGFYDWLNFGPLGRPDQPMLNILYDWLIRQLYLLIFQPLWFINTHLSVFPSSVMTWYEQNGNQVLLKMPMILADLLLIYLVHRFVAKTFSIKLANLGAIILGLFLPIFYNSAIWGSGDSIINLLGLASLYLLFTKKYSSSFLLFLCSILYKSSLLIWSPLFLVILLSQKPKLTKLILPLIFSIVLIFLVAQPFTPQGSNPFLWFYQTITQKILPGPMAQLTSNAFNYWALLFGLVPRLDELLVFNFLPARSFSLLFCLILYLPIWFNLYKNLTIKTILLSLVNVTLITFIFMTRMHERYTFPALIPLFLLCFYDRKFIKYFLILSITHMLNVYNWWWYPQINILVDFLKIDLVIRLLSLTNILLFVSLFLEQIRPKSAKLIK